MLFLRERLLTEAIFAFLCGFGRLRLSAAVSSHLQSRRSFEALRCETRVLDSWTPEWAPMSGSWILRAKPTAGQLRYF